MRPIDADVLEKYLNARVAKLRKEYGNYDAYTDGFDDAVAAVELSPTLTLDDLGIVRCSDCAWFDDEGYENYDPEMPELRMGFCKVWRRDTQACRFCSMGGGK